MLLGALNLLIFVRLAWTGFGLIKVGQVYLYQGELEYSMCCYNTLALNINSC